MHISDGPFRSAVAKLSLILVITVCAGVRVAADTLLFSRSDPPENQTQRLLTEMSDEEALGQLFMLGFSGTTPSAEIIKWIRKRSLGGVKIFGWNVGSLPGLAECIGEMQSYARDTRLRIPLLIATDQEGGWVRHVKDGTSETAGNMAIGATGLPYDAFETGYYIGMELRALGINMNFAPTVDVYTNPQAHVIGPRAFSDDPVETGMLSVAYFKGLQAAGVISTAKHYPGHGGADQDSHGALPIIKRTFDQLWNCDLVPYRFLVKEGLPAIMGGHLAFPLITGNKTPATLSKYFHSDILRDKLGFKGLTITDDILMNGITETGYSIEKISELAIEAGNDMVLISRGPEIYERVWNYLLAKMHKDPQFRERVFEAASRVLELKRNYLTGKNAVPLRPDPEEVKKYVPNKKGGKFFFDLACRSVSVIRGEGIPLKAPLGKVLLAGQFSTFISEGRNRFPGSAGIYYPFTPFYFSRTKDIERLRELIPRYDTLIFCLANPNSEQVLQAILPEVKRNNTRLIVFSVLTPVYLENIPEVSSAIAVYGISDDSFRAGFAVLAGDYQAEGTIPLSAMQNGKNDQK